MVQAKSKAVKRGRERERQAPVVPLREVHRRIRAKVRIQRGSALDEAHQIATKYIHCPTLFGDKKHNALEHDIAKALTAAFYRGGGGRR